MRHRCEACDQLVSFAGHNCGATNSIIALKRALEAKLAAAAHVIITSIQGSAPPPLIKLMEMQMRDPERFAKAAELSKTTIKSFQEAWDEMEPCNRCPECGAIQFTKDICAHGLGCSRGAKLTHASSLESAAIKVHGDPDAFGRVISVDEDDDEDPLESDAVRAYESSIADMLNEREAEGDDEG